MEGKYKRKPTVALALSIIHAKNNPEVDWSEWFRADEVAALLGKSLGNIYVIAARNGWPKAKVGHHVYYKQQAILDYLEARK